MPDNALSRFASGAANFQKKSESDSIREELASEICSSKQERKGSSLTEETNDGIQAENLAPINMQLHNRTTPCLFLRQAAAFALLS